MRPLQRYELDERIGVGALAEVFRGTGITRDGERRPVLVKRLLEPFSRDREFVARFWQEARTASILAHPNVVELLDAGTMDGRLFLAWEYVDGADLQRIVSRVREGRRRLTVGAVLHVVYEILKGVHHVHSRTNEDGEPLGIVHRELSPANVVVSRAGEVKLADVGLAKATIRSGHVVSGAIQGDPHYMAPEQLAGTRVDARTDVYAAGMVLFTLLAGAHPMGDLPVGQLLPKILSGSIPPLAKLRPDLPAPLAEATMRAIAANPANRFSTAQEFQLALIEYANDKKIRLEGRKLADFLAVNFPGGSPEQDLAPSPVPSIEAPFNPVVVEASRVEEAPVPEGSIVRGPMQKSVFATLAGTPEPRRPGKSRLRRTTALREDPAPEARSARRRKTVIRERAPAAEPRWSPPPAPPHEAEPSRTRRSEPAAPTQMRSARARSAPRPSSSVPARGAPRIEVPAPIVAKAIPPRKEARDASHATWLIGHEQSVSAAAFLPDGRRAITGGHDQTLIVWDLQKRRVERILEKHVAAVTAIAVSRDGALAISASRDRTLQTWDVSSGLPVATLEGARGWVFSVDLTADGTRAVSAGVETVIRLWDVTSSRQTGTLAGHEDSVSQVAFLPDGTRALSGSRDGTVRLWDLRLRKELRVFPVGESVRAVAVSPDGRLALSAGAEPVLRLWDLAKGVELHRFEGHREPVSAVSFTADGSRAVSGGYDGTIRVWDLRSGTALHAYHGHVDPILALAVSPDAHSALSAGADKRVALWSLPR